MYHMHFFLATKQTCRFHIARVHFYFLFQPYQQYPTNFLLLVWFRFVTTTTNSIRKHALG